MGLLQSGSSTTSNTSGDFVANPVPRAAKTQIRSPSAVEPTTINQHTAIAEHRRLFNRQSVSLANFARRESFVKFAGKGTIECAFILFLRSFICPYINETLKIPNDESLLLENSAIS